MVDKRNVHQLAGGHQFFCKLSVVLARARVAAGVVVAQNYRRCHAAQRAHHHEARVDYHVGHAAIA